MMIYILLFFIKDLKVAVIKLLIPRQQPFAQISIPIESDYNLDVLLNLQIHTFQILLDVLLNSTDYIYHTISTINNKTSILAWNALFSFELKDVILKPHLPFQIVECENRSLWRGLNQFQFGNESKCPNLKEGGLKYESNLLRNWADL